MNPTGRATFGFRFFLSAIVILVPAFLCNAQSDTVRISRYIEKGSYYLLKHEGEKEVLPGEKEDRDSAKYFFDHALRLSHKIGSDKWVNKSRMWKGNYFIDVNDLDSGRACFQKVIAFYQSKNDLAAEANAWRHLGNCLPSNKKLFATEKAKCLEKAYELYWKTGDKMNAMESLKAAADAHLYEPNLDVAERELLTVASNYKAMHYGGLHFTYYLLVAVSELKGDVVNQLRYAMQMVLSLDSAVLGTRYDSLQAGRLYSFAGLSYAYVGLWDRALFYARKGWPNLQLTPWNEEYFSRMENLCIALVRNDSAHAALKVVEQCLRQREVASAFQQARIAYVLAVCYESLGEMDKARNQFSKLPGIVQRDKLFDEPRHFQWRQEMMIAAGNFYLSTHDYDKANFYARQLPLTYAYLTTIGQKGHIELLKSRVDSTMGRYRSALKHFSTYQMMHDSLFGIQKTARIQDLEMKIALAKKDNDLRLQSANVKLLAKESELHQVQAGESRLERNLMAIVVVFLVLLTAILYNRYRLKRRKSIQLELQQLEIAAKNHELEHLLRENEWLLKEVHHRVKNNLQTVTSLLTSQMESAEKGPAVDAIRESRQRIEAIAMIHQRLYNGESYSSIVMPAYVADLVEHLREAFGPGPRIVFSLAIDPISLDISVALPAALILNEAISNSLKHGFPGEMQGTINVRLCYVAENKVMLEVTDNGIGFSERTVISSKSFGIRLIKGLTSDVSGESEILNGTGTTVRVRFSIDSETGKANHA